MAESDSERLQRDLAGAYRAAQTAEAEAGRLRGQIAEMQTQLARARQDQESFQRWLDAKRRTGLLLARLSPRIRRMVRRSPQ